MNYTVTLSLEDWTTAIDLGRSVDVIYLDFMQKAFDHMPHSRLNLMILMEIYLDEYRTFNLT